MFMQKYVIFHLETFRNGLENVSIVFSKPEKRASWEESFNEAKHKLGKSDYY